MQAVILAGGLATRLRPITTKIPKAMVSINGRPFLEYQIELLKHQGIEDIVICIGYLGNLIREHFGNGQKFDISIRYSDEGLEMLGTGGALKAAEPLLDKEFLVINGDSYLVIDTYAVIHSLRSSGKLGTLVAFHSEHSQNLANLIVKDGLVRHYSKNIRLPEMNHIDAGISAFHKRALDHLPEMAKVDMGQLYTKLIDQKELMAYEAEHRFYDIGTLQGLQDFETFVKTNPNFSSRTGWIN